MLACSPPPHLDSPQYPLSRALLLPPYAQLVHDIMTYLRQVGAQVLGPIWVFWIRTAVCRYVVMQSVQLLVIVATRQRTDCYDYLHSTTLSHLKATN